MALTYFSVDNFRTFGANGKPAEFDLAPITVLTGTNNSGKSSLIKAINVFKYLVDNLNLINKIEFRNPTLNLGSFKQLKSTYITKDEMTFNIDFNKNIKLEYRLEEFNDSSVLKSISLKFNNSNEEVPIVSINFTERDLCSTVLNFKTKINFEKINIIYDLFLTLTEKTYSYKAERFRLIEENMIEAWKKIKSFMLPLEFDMYAVGHDFDFLGFEHIQDWMYDVYDEKNYTFLHDFYSKIRFKQIRDNLLSKSEFINLLPEIKKKLEEIEDDTVKKSLSEFIIFYQYVGKYIDNNPIIDSDEYWKELINYLDKDMQDNTEYKFLYDDIDEMESEYYISDLLFTSLNLMQLIILHSSKELIKFKVIDDFYYKLDHIFSYKSKQTSYHFTEEVIHQINNNLEFLNSDQTLEMEINKWLRFFEIAEKINIVNYDFGFQLQFLDKNDSYKDLIDLGSGSSTLISIILAIYLYRFKHGSPYVDPYSSFSLTLVIEEPEQRLHPELQSKLANLFVEAYEKFGIRFIIETHSEYLIRKFQYLIAKKQLNKDDLNIYYFGKDPTMDDYITKIEIDENGFMKNDFGEGFFDEASKLIGNLWEVNRKI